MILTAVIAVALAVGTWAAIRKMQARDMLYRLPELILSDLEADRDVWEPDELWAAAHLRQPTGTSPPPRRTPPKGVGGPLFPEMEVPRLLQQNGAINQQLGVTVDNNSITDQLSGTGNASLDHNKLVYLTVKAVREFGYIEARLNSLSFQLTERDWSKLFRAVNRASNNRLMSYMQDYTKALY